MNRWLADRKTTNLRFRKRRNCARASGHSFFRRSHMDADSKKKAAALAALEYVEDGMTVGVGTGSTVNHFIAALKDRRQRIAGAVSSSGSQRPPAQGSGHRGPSAQRHRRPLALRRRRRRGHPSPRIDQGRRRCPDPGKDRGRGKPALCLHRRRLQGRGRAGPLSPPRRGHPDGPVPGRAEARGLGGPAGPAPGLPHGQRQRDPRRAQPEDHRPRPRSRRRSGCWSAWSRSGCSRGAVRTCCWSRGMGA